MEGGVCADLDLAEKEEKGLEERQPPILLVLYMRSERARVTSALVGGL